MKKKIIVFIILAVSVATCKKDSGPYVISPPLPPVPVLISFTNEIQPILDSYCISCHDENHPTLNLKPCCSWYELWTTGVSAPYLDTLNPAQSLLYERIDGTISPQMPIGGPTLTQSEMDKILQWIQEGAKNN